MCYANIILFAESGQLFSMVESQILQVLVNCYKKNYGLATVKYIILKIISDLLKFGKEVSKNSGEKKNLLLKDVVDDYEFWEMLEKEMESKQYRVAKMATVIYNSYDYNTSILLLLLPVLRI